MNHKNSVLPPLVFTVLFALVFHKQAWGINYFLFELLVIGWLFFTKQFELKGRNMITVVACVLSTLIFTLVSHSSFVYFINIFAFLFFVGQVVYPKAKSLLTSLGMGFSNFTAGQDVFFKQLNSSQHTGSRAIKYVKRLKLVFIPILIIILFVAIYSSANPVFGNLVGDFFTSLADLLSNLAFRIDFLIIFTLFIGFLFSNYILMHKTNAQLALYDEKGEEVLTHKRNPLYKFRVKIGGNLALLNEYRSAVFLLAVLNGILLIVNCIDINWVWFNFSWEGQYLKQFVHEGTYMLILSILISIAVVLYYFRANLNFYSKNKWLKYLSYTWLAQNAVLTLSVAIRNFWYISYFSLAYKRIGVLIFLALTLYGLYTVFVKVKMQRSAFYLFKVNTYAVLVVLTVCSWVNWDVAIARYNFAHANESYLHLNFMADLSSSALPYIDKPLEEVKKIKLEQESSFPFEIKGRIGAKFGDIYMTPEKYCETIAWRKTQFIKKWEEKSILEWNWAEYSAYKQLTAK